MEGRAVYDDPERLEQLLCAAESRARDGKPNRLQQADKDLSEMRVAGTLLLSAAERELERRNVRTRHLPIALLSDTAWAILLDLFVCDQRSVELALAGCGSRWRVSDATAARQIAVLIESQLVARARARDDRQGHVLQLTAEGRSKVSRVLELYL
jgi:DNA-binding MarR family transcriptional regulator